MASARELRRDAGRERSGSPPWEHAAHTVLWPALEKLLPGYPVIDVEVVVEQSFSDIVAERFDAGVRLGELIAKDMVAVRIGPDLRMAVVGSPVLFRELIRPADPPQDLAQHQCINLRLPTGRRAGCLGAAEGPAGAPRPRRRAAVVQRRRP